MVTGGDIVRVERRATGERGGLGGFHARQNTRGRRPNRLVDAGRGPRRRGRRLIAPVSTPRVRTDASRIGPLADTLTSLAYVSAVLGSDVRERRSGPRYVAVRTVEILVASIVLIITSPILLAMVIAIRLDSPGPAMFRQRRVGLDLKPFTLYKARTLYVDAKERFPDLYRYKFTREQVRELTLSDLKTPTDPRVTRVGRWLRRTSIDELPNFINVLRG